MGDTYRNKWILDAEDRTKAAFASAAQNARGLDRQISTMMRSAGPAGILGAIGMGSVAGIINREISDTADELDSLAKRARAVGMVTEELDSLEYAARKNGIAEDQLAIALKTLMKQMSDTARGAGEGKVAFDALGIKVTDGEGRMKRATAVMAEVADGLQKIESAENRAAYMQKIFGESGVGMVNMLDDGSKGLRTAVAEGYALSIRYQDMAVKGEAYKEAQLRLNRSVRGIKDAVVASALPGLTTLAAFMSRDALHAVTGLDDEFRTFLGTMRTLPAQMALDEMSKKERDLVSQVDAANKALEEQRANANVPGVSIGGGPMGSHWVSPEQRGLLKATANAADARAELAALRQEIERTRAEMAQDAKVQNYYNGLLDDLTKAATAAAAAEGNAADATAAAAAARERLNEGQQRALQIITDLWSPEQRFNYELAQNLELVRAGYLSWSQYFKWFQRARAEMRGVADEIHSATTDIAGASNTAADGLTRLQEVGVEAARGINDGFSRMVRGQMRTLEDFADFASDLLGNVADQIVQRYVTDAIVAAISHGASGAPAGNQSGKQTGSGFSSTANKSMGGGGFTLVQNISAVDGPSVARMLREQEPTIVGMVEKAYNRAGRRGPNG